MQEDSAAEKDTNPKKKRKLQEFSDVLIILTVILQEQEKK